jgi:hypothetical protein
MSPTAEQVKEQFFALPESDRELLLGELTEMATIGQRIAEIDSGEVEGVSTEKVLAEARAILNA